MTIFSPEKRTHVNENSGSGPTTSQSPPAARYNVLKIVPSSFFADYGCHVRIFEESQALRAMGHQVSICTYHNGSDVPGVEIYRALNTPWHNSITVGSSKRKLYYDVFLSATCLEAALRIRPDLIHAHLHEGALIGYPLSRLLRVPLVFDFQGSLTSEMLDHNFISRDSLFFQPLRGVEWAIDRMADAIITSSRNAAGVLVKDFGCPPKKIFTVADRVNPEFFRSKWETPGDPEVERLRTKLAIPRDRKVVVYLGLLAEYQGVGKLLEAAHALIKAGQSVHFLIMGFPGVEMYQGMAAQLGIMSNITFTGRVPYMEAPDHLLLGDVAAAPKMSETEGNGKLLNYMAAGLPTVTFDTPVAREILGDLGVYARLGDAASLADCLSELLSDDAAARRRGQELRKKAVEQFSWSEGGHLIEEVYRVVCR